MPTRAGVNVWADSLNVDGGMALCNHVKISDSQIPLKLPL